MSGASPEADGSGLPLSPAVALEPRRAVEVPPYDVARAEAAVRELLLAVGEDPEREGLR